MPPIVKLIRYLKLTFLIVAVILAAATGILIGVSASQRPIPGSGQTQRSEPQQQAADAQQQASKNPAGTNEAPFVVQIKPTAKADSETAKEERKEDREASTYRWTIGLAVVTGIVSILQLVMIGLQAAITERQNTIMENQSDIMKEQREAAHEQAGYMADSLIETRKATAATALSASVAEQTLRTTQRAFLILGGWKSVPVTITKESGLTAIDFTINNKGNTFATITERYTHVTLAPELPETPQFVPLSTIRSVPIGPSGSLSQRVTIGPIDSFSTDWPDKHLWFWGYIVYRDAFGAKHKIGFCLKYGDGAWRLDGPDAYNYAD